MVWQDFFFLRVESDFLLTKTILSLSQQENFTSEIRLEKADKTVL